MCISNLVMLNGDTQLGSNFENFLVKCQIVLFFGHADQHHNVQNSFKSCFLKYENLEHLRCFSLTCINNKVQKTSVKIPYKRKYYNRYLVSILFFFDGYFLFKLT